MRFFVIWQDSEGFAAYAEHFEHKGMIGAQRAMARKFDRREAVERDINGFLVVHADSEFIRRYTKSPSLKTTRTERCETELACQEYRHLLRPLQQKLADQEAARRIRESKQFSVIEHLEQKFGKQR